MPILNLNNPAFISVTGAGRPNSGGSVAVYSADGLFTTLATIYSDQQKTTPLTNPVTLDDAGAIEIWYEVKVDIQERLSDGTAFRDTLNLDPNAGDPVIQGFNLVDNGSFEVDETSDGQPDNWTITPYVGSAIAITETIVRNGVKALEFNTAGAGTGGGVAVSTKFPVTEGSVCSVAFSFFATNATTLNTFKINWYDQDDVLKSTSTVTMPASGSVPTSWTEYQEEITVDAAGTQGEVELTGISSGGANLSSKAYFDGIKIINMENVVTLTGNQTIAGTKIYTSPTINTPTINDATINGGAIVIGTKQTPTATAVVDFTGIDTWIKKITILIDRVTITGAGSIFVTIGSSGTPVTTGYFSQAGDLQDGAGTPGNFDITGGTSNFKLTSGNVLGAATITHGVATLHLMDATDNIWVFNANLMTNNTDWMHIATGTLSLGAGNVLDIVRLTASNNYTAGSISINTEG